MALSFVKDEAKPRRSAARQGRVLDQAQGRSKLAAMDLRRSLREAPCAYRDIQGFDFDDECAAAACSRWNLPPLGGFGRAAIFSFLRRSARWIGVSSGLSVMAPT